MHRFQLILAAVWLAFLPVAACSSAALANGDMFSGDPVAQQAWLEKGLMKQPLYGFIDKSGHFSINPTYNFAGQFSEKAALVRAHRTFQYIDPEGKLLFERDTKGPVTVTPRPFKQGLALTFQPEGCGYVDNSGKFVIAPKYQAAGDFSEGLAQVCYGAEIGHSTWGFIDKSGKLVIAGPFESAMGFSNGLAAARKDDRWGYIDPTGSFVIKPQYLAATDFCENRAAVVTDGLWVYIDKSGKAAFDGSFSYAMPFSDGIAVVCRDKEGDVYECIDASGKSINLSLQPIASCTEGLIRVKDKNGKFGFADKSGAIVIAPQYEATLAFAEGLAAVSLDGKWGFIDKSGKMVIKPAFIDVKPFSEGLAGAAPIPTSASIPTPASTTTVAPVPTTRGTPLSMRSLARSH